MDMKSLFVDLVLNVITRVAVGSWELEVGQLNELVKESFLVGGAPNLGDFLPALRWVDLLGEEKRVMRLQGKRDRLLQELVDDRRRRGVAGQEGKKTLLDALLDLQKLDPEYYDDNFVKGLIVVHFHFSLIIWFYFLGLIFFFSKTSWFNVN